MVGDIKDKNKVHWLGYKHGLEKVILTYATQCLYKWKPKRTHTFCYLSLLWRIHFYSPNLVEIRVTNLDTEYVQILWCSEVPCTCSEHGPMPQRFTAMTSHSVQRLSYRLDCWGIFFSILVREKRLFYSSKHPVRLWGRSNHHSVSARGFYTGYIAIGTLNWPSHPCNDHFYHGKSVAILHNFHHCRCPTAFANSYTLSPLLTCLKSGVSGTIKMLPSIICLIHTICDYGRASIPST